MAPFFHLTIQDPAEGIYREKGSKFLAFAYPVHSEEEIKICLSALKKDYADARHHAYAWRLGTDAQKFRAFDDGEPGHTAGDPILGQIRSRELTNILVVVVRYFGGVKLGVGGLIQAYRSAANEALKNATIVQREVVVRVEIFYDYAATTEVTRMIRDFELDVVSQNFAEACRMELGVKLRYQQLFDEKIQLLQATGVKVTKGQS